MELWDIYDTNKKITGRLINKKDKDKMQDGEYHLAVGAIIINTEGKILLGKRSEKLKKFPLKWECCGGSAKAGETSLYAILRELNEEFGIKLNPIDAIFYKSVKTESKKAFKDFWLFKKEISLKEINFNDGEMIDAKYVTIKEFNEMFKNNEIVPTVCFTESDYHKCMNLEQDNTYNYLGKTVDVYIDRPLNSIHPKHSDIKYEVNYGYIPNTISGDGEEIDCYVLGIDKPLKEFRGRCIAIVNRLNDNEKKLIIAQEDKMFNIKEIREKINFQEKFFDTEIILMKR